MATLPNKITFAQAMVKACNVLNSLSWVEGSCRCDLRKVKTKNQTKPTKMLLNSPLSFLFFVYFLVLQHLSSISLFSSLSPETSIDSFSFHLIILQRGSSSAVVDFQVASHFQLIAISNILMFDTKVVLVWPSPHPKISNNALQMSSNVGIYWEKCCADWPRLWNNLQKHNLIK